MLGLARKNSRGPEFVRDWLTFVQYASEFSYGNEKQRENESSLG